MNECMQTNSPSFPLQIADVGYCRYFLRTRQLNSPFASTRPSVRRPQCPLGNGAEVVSQAIARMDRDTHAIAKSLR